MVRNQQPRMFQDWANSVPHRHLCSLSHTKVQHTQQPHSFKHCSIPPPFQERRRTEQFTRALLLGSLQESIGSALCFLFQNPLRENRLPNWSCSSSLPSHLLKVFARCADEVCTPYSCSPVMPPPDHRMENDIGTAELRFNWESSVHMGQRIQEIDPSWDCGLHFQSTSVPSLSLACNRHTV